MEFLDLRKPISAPSQAAQQVLDYLQTHDLAAFENGSHQIAGDDFYFNLFTFQSNTAAERIWEAHREFIDVHIVLTGEEIVGQQFLPDVKTGEYHPESDYLEITPMAEEKRLTRLVLKAGYMAIFYPEDAHQTGVSLTDQRTEIRKAVFKIKVAGNHAKF